MLRATMPMSRHRGGLDVTHRRLLAFLLLVEVAATGTMPVAHAAYVPGRLLVKLAPDLAVAVGEAPGRVPATGSPRLDDLIRRHGGRAIRAPFAGWQARAA